jgi:hypothetical protein
MIKTQGVTLIELLVVSFMTALITIGAATAFRASVDFQRNVLPQRERVVRIQRFEDRLRNLLSKAYISADENDTATYFALGSLTGETTTNEDDLPTSVTFTTFGNAPTGGAVASVETFEEIHSKYGPQGGTAEYTLGTEPIGDAGDRTGLFLRTQRPSDGDPTQGGEEEVFFEGLQSIGFEAWDGTAWVTEWDSVSLQERRLPAALRITYRLSDEANRPKTVIIRLAASDVTPQDPASGGATGGEGGQG